jgi:phosphatidylinositol glycan class B
MEALAFFPQFRASILVLIPKLLQGLFAAIGDYFTWKLAGRIYGRGSNSSWTAVCRGPVKRQQINRKTSR